MRYASRPEREVTPTSTSIRKEGLRRVSTHFSNTPSARAGGGPRRGRHRHLPDRAPETAGDDSGAGAAALRRRDRHRYGPVVTGGALLEPHTNPLPGRTVRRVHGRELRPIAGWLRRPGGRGLPEAVRGRLRVLRESRQQVSLQGEPGGRHPLLVRQEHDHLRELERAAHPGERSVCEGGLRGGCQHGCRDDSPSPGRSGVPARSRHQPLHLPRNVLREGVRLSLRPVVGSAERCAIARQGQERCGSTSGGKGVWLKSNAFSRSFAAASWAAGSRSWSVFVDPNTRSTKRAIEA